jgi:hypothetical protein
LSPPSRSASTKARRRLSIALFCKAAAIRAGDWGGCNEIAKRVRAQIDGYVTIGIANSGGMILCAGSDGPAGVRASGQFAARADCWRDRWPSAIARSTAWQDPDLRYPWRQMQEPG